MVPSGVFSTTPGHDYDFARSISDAGVNVYLCLAAFVILYYDYLLTLPLEVERYWGERFNWSWTTVFFFLGRYFPLFGQIPIIVLEVLPWKIEMLCPSLTTYHQVYIVASEVIVSILLLLRTYALYNRNKKMLAFLLTVALTLLGLGCWGITRRSANAPEEPPEIGCHTGLSDESAHNILTVWSCLFAFDLVIFCLTLQKALSLRNDGARPLMEVILRDGTMYFGVLAAAYLSNILTLIHGTTLTKGATSTLSNVLATVLISRLMLNIRKPDLALHGRGGSETWTTTYDAEHELVTTVLTSPGTSRWASGGSEAGPSA